MEETKSKLEKIFNENELKRKPHLKIYNLISYIDEHRMDTKKQQMSLIIQTLFPYELENKWSIQPIFTENSLKKINLIGFTLTYEDCTFLTFKNDREKEKFKDMLV